MKSNLAVYWIWWQQKSQNSPVSLRLNIILSWIKRFLKYRKISLFIVNLNEITKKNNKYRTVGIIPKSNIKIVERGKIDTPDSEGRLRTKLYDKRDNFNFPIVNFLFICSNIPAAPVHGVYISQLIRYSRACGSYQDFLRGLLLTGLSKGFSWLSWNHHFECLVDRYGISVSQMITDMFHL